MITVEVRAAEKTRKDQDRRLLLFLQGETEWNISIGFSDHEVFPVLMSPLASGTYTIPKIVVALAIRLGT